MGVGTSRYRDVEPQLYWVVLDHVTREDRIVQIGRDAVQVDDGAALDHRSADGDVGPVLGVGPWYRYRNQSSCDPPWSSYGGFLPDFGGAVTI